MATRCMNPTAKARARKDDFIQWWMGIDEKEERGKV